MLYCCNTCKRSRYVYQNESLKTLAFQNLVWGQDFFNQSIVCNIEDSRRLKCFRTSIFCLHFLTWNVYAQYVCKQKHLKKYAKIQLWKIKNSLKGFFFFSCSGMKLPAIKLGPHSHTGKARYETLVKFT